MPYKDAATRRTKVRAHQARYRSKWMAKQRCCLCGAADLLSVFRNMGAPELSWSVDGPSHRRYRVACTDPVACLRRRAGVGERAVNEGARGRPRNTPESTPQPKKLSTEDRRKLRVMRAPVPESKLTRELRDLDGRPCCPRHGPKGTMIYKGAARFVCCGLVVPGSKPEPKPWYAREIKGVR